MENMLEVESRLRVTLSLLRDITNGFSDDRLIGDGRFGAVYKGVLGDGQVIAVRMLSPVGEIDDVQLRNLVAYLAKYRHRNIVRLLGYCYEQEQLLIPYNGKHVFALKTHRALCLEYTHNRSLHHYISDISCGLDWNMRYAIIKGVCEGLRYLHEGSKSPVIHMDLTPSSILLDQTMTPKISDFGLSRLIGEGNVKRTGTVEYMPPEFIERQVISYKYDIFSLGVIMIKVMTGQIFYSEYSDISHGKFTELVLEKWRERLHDATSVRRYCQQVRKCLEIALKCVEPDRHERPSMGEIIHMLNQTETLIPEEIHVEQKRSISFLLDVQVFSYSLQLKNRGDDRVAYMLVSNNTNRYLKDKFCGVVPPGSADTLPLTKLKQIPPTSPDSSDFLTMYIAKVGQCDLLDVEKDYEDFFKKSDKVQVARLMVICSEQGHRVRIMARCHH